MATELPRSTPEARGIPSSAILEFIETAERDIHELHSLMLLRHGQVVAEGWWTPYGPEIPHMLFSLSKSFTSTAIGLAVEEGLLSIDDPVLEFFPDDAPETVSENLATMRVRHLLSMSTGHAIDTTAFLQHSSDGNWARAFLERPVEYTPGTHFLYNTGATYMLSAIIQHLTGITLLEYLRPRLLDPLGIKQATWETCPRGINTGGFGLNTTTDAIARFGQLFLQRGEWNGQQLVPAAWVDEATSKQIDNAPSESIDWVQGYGYQFWRCRHNAYRGDGAFGQFCIVMPEQDVVVAITSGVGPMQPVLDLVWDTLLPAFGASALPADDTSHAALLAKLESLALLPPAGEKSSPITAQVSGNTYTFEPNELQFETIAYAFDDAGCKITLRDQNGEHTFVSSSGEWHKGITTHPVRGGSQQTVGAGVWVAADTYLAQIRYYETPFYATLRSQFVEDRLLLDYSVNVAFGPTTFPQMTAQRG